MAKAVLVTGGAGFIGSTLVRQLLMAGETVIVLDRLSHGGSESNLPKHPKLVFVRGDVTDATLLRGLPPLAAIYHLAAETHVDRSLQETVPFVRSNVEGTATLLDVFRHQKVKILIASTDEVYGSRTEPAKETDPVRPGNPYAVTKLAAEQLGVLAAKAYGTPVVVTRACNTYGPRQHEEKFLPKLIRALLLGEPFPLYGNGEQIREWLHVDDHAAALRAVMTHGAPGEVYNVGSGLRLQNLQMLEQVEWLVGKKVQRQRGVDRVLHDTSYALNSDKIRRLGWQPKVDLRLGLQATIEYYANRYGQVLPDTVVPIDTRRVDRE